MGQQHGIGRTMGNMEMSTQLVRHTVVQAQTGGIEGQTGQRGCGVHFLAGMGVIVVQIAAQQVAAHDLNGLLTQSLAELIVAQADAALHCVGKYIHAGVGG